VAIVYQHRRKDNYDIFYIGIGKTEARAYYAGKNRGKPWKDFVKNHEYYVEITHKDIIWEEACSIEKYLIAFYGRRDLGQGSLVNMTYGGDGIIGYKFTKSDIEKMSKQQTKENNGFWNKKHKPETIELFKKQKSRSNHPMRNKKQSQETILKISMALKGRFCSNKKQVRDMITNKIYETIALAAEDKKVATSTIHYWIKKGKFDYYSNIL
jgi:hypothetical protein